MTIPLIVLAVLSIIGGLLGVPHFMSEAIGLHLPNFIEEFLGSSVHTMHHEAHHGLGHWTLVGLSVLAAFLGIGLGVYQFMIKPGLMAKKIEKGNISKGLYSGSLNKWYVDEFYNDVFVQPFNSFSEYFAKFDLSIIDGALNGLSDLVKKCSAYLSSLQSGLLRYYAAVMVFGVVIIIAIMFF